MATEDGGDVVPFRKQLKVTQRVDPDSPIVGLAHGEKGPRKTPGNVAIWIALSGEWDVRFDRFRDEVMVLKCPKVGLAPARLGPLDEYHVVLAIQWIAKDYGLVFSPEPVEMGIRQAARQQSYHPVKEYLKSITWDGVPRVETWLRSYLGAEESPVVDAMGRMWMISAVARAMEPGVKVDHMLVLLGAQADRKTTALETLCGKEWFQPELPDLRNKDSQILLLGSWIVCMDEMHALRSADVTELAKNYLTRCFDRYVPKYGRRSVNQPRGCVFAATGNSPEYLHDPTGNRRYWSVIVGTVDLEAIKRDRDQLWAESLALYTDGAQWWPDKSTARSIDERNHAHMKHDEWERAVADACFGREAVTIGDCLSELGIEKGKWTQQDQNRVARALRLFGRTRVQRRLNGKRVWVYVNPEQENAEVDGGTDEMPF
jgi:putative DNA primase/helicase